jgi:hypothetical protein
LAVGDLNGDGIPDIVSVGGYVSYGKGNGAFTTPVGYTIDRAQSVPVNVLVKVCATTAGTTSSPVDTSPPCC